MQLPGLKVEKKMEGIVLPDFKHKHVIIDVDRTLEVSAPAQNVKLNLAISMYAKKFKGIGHDIMLCQGLVPL